ncbi:Aste57867_20140 [Aphanomyces stellatus]|uniref:Aste57867_20140 protein n=1 Tax=Aphanomyces stellatus TaxID=120398 RepID=A0A485LFT9_9STRA|nr:hypothetical protein As57867_020074 [Aphanomyces stellatus]VFT96835.1 Aste57867_20140 [Aphanomyces stellatus]
MTHAATTCNSRVELGFTERAFIDWSLRITSALSAAGCIYMIARYLSRPKAERDIASKMAVALAWFELMIALVKAPSTYFVKFESHNTTYSRAAVQPGALATTCQVQAYFIQVFMLQAVLWNNCMAYNLLRWVVYRDPEEKLQSRFWIYLFSTGFFSVVWGLGTALPLWTYHSHEKSSLFGFARFFCWFRDPTASLAAFISFVVLTLAFSAAVAIKIRRVVAARAKQQSVYASVDDDVQAIQNRLFLFVFAFFCLHLPPVLYRVFQALYQNKDPEYGDDMTTRVFDCRLDAMKIFGILAQIIINLQGFVDAMIYGGFFVRWCKRSPPRDSVLAADRPPSIFLEDVESSHSGSHFGHRNHHPKHTAHVSIFASTFNMAEGAVPTDRELETWIPSGHNVYVIGVQECLNLPAMRYAMATHLRKLHGKSFVEYGREIGRKETMLGYHGFIAITVYVSAEDVQAGNFYMHLEAISKVHRGKNLMGLGRASNKGAVGFAFRYFNSTFAVVTCHLASDSTGKSKVKKRHRDGMSILGDMHLQAIDNEFDCHLMAHHTIFMGDLNYRLTAREASPDRILNMITAVVNSNCRNRSFKRGLVFSHDQLMPRGFDETTTTPTSTIVPDNEYVLINTPMAMQANQYAGLPPPILVDAAVTPHHQQSDIDSSFSSVASALSFSDVTWKALLDHDELKRSMAGGVIYHDFDEAMISFAPTYRRVLHSILDPTHVWTVDQVAQLYTVHLGEGKVRVPSYTDRILFHSLPGMRERFYCIHYGSTEEIGTSDHKPVSCVFEVVTDKPHRAPAPLACSAHDAEPRKKTKLHLFTLVLTALQVRWAPALETFSSEGETDDQLDPLDQPSSLLQRKGSSQGGSRVSEPTQVGSSVVDGLRVRSVFPLPCEDEFAEERQLAAVADQMLQDPTQPHRRRRRQRLQPTSQTNTWSALAEHGLKQCAVVTPQNHLHAALSFVDPSGASVGQGVVGLVEASLRLGHPIEFTSALSMGGRRTGELTGTAMLMLEKITE